MTSYRLSIFGFLTISSIRGVCISIKVRNKFTKVKYSGPNRFVIFVANYWRFGIFGVSWYGRSHRCILKNTRQTNKFHSFVNERNFDEVAFMIYFGMDVRTESIEYKTS